MTISKEKIEAYALKNALEHDGKASAGSVLNSLFLEGLKKEHIKEIMPEINSVVKEINILGLEKQKEKFMILEHNVKKREIREGLPLLPGAEQSKVVMRFAPFPSGAIHIGNTRQLILNDEYAKKYDGKFILFIDDTIGSAEKQIVPEAYDLIEDAVQWLGIKVAGKTMYKSDRLDIYYQYAEEMIKKGYMYVCNCSRERMSDFRVKGLECGCRHLPLQEQLGRWQAMFSAKEGDYTVRLKTSMADSNPAFRDRVMFKISDRIHPRVQDKYRIWPSMDFSWAIDDMLIGTTHIIRGVDLLIETRVEQFIWDIFKWKHPVTIHTGFFTIKGIKLSKSKGQREVLSGQYIGWNDPRTWSLQSLRARGISPLAIREFCTSMGLTKNNAIVDVDILYGYNKKYVENSKRYFFVPNPVKITVKGTPTLKADIPYHPSEELNLGSRNYEIQQNFFISQEDYNFLKEGYCRLMHLLTCKVELVKFSGEKTFKFISKENDKKLNPGYLQWVSADNDYFQINVRMPDNFIVSGFGEEALGELQPGDIVQFERFGFVKLYAIDKVNRRAEFWFCHK